MSARPEAPVRRAIVMPLAEQRGGAELFLLHLLRAEAARGVRVPVAFLEPGPMADEAAALGHAVEVVEGGRMSRPLALGRAVRRLARWLRAERAGAVLAWMQKGHVYAAPAGRLAGVPALWFQHALPTGRPLDRLVAALPAAGVVCCSAFVAEAQRAFSPRTPSAVVYPAVDLARFDALPPRAEARRALGLGAGPLVLMAARLQRWKGVHVFVEAAARLAADRPDARFVVVGGRHDREPAYADEVAALATAAGVRLEGHRSDVPLWMRAADVVVHASVGAEPFGMVVVEGLAAGAAVVAADDGGPREALAGGEGRLVPPADAAALAQAVGDLLDEPPAARAARAERGRARAAAFAASALPDRLDAACRRLLRDR